MIVAMLVGFVDSIGIALSGIDLSTFALLTAAGLVGVLAVIPYQLANTDVEVSLPVVVANAVVVNGLLVAVAVALGLTVGEWSGFAVVDTPPWGTAGYVAIAVLGAVVGITLVGLDRFCFQRALSAETASDLEGVDATDAGPRLGLLASVYGAITEELLVRFGLLTLLAWIGWQLLAPGASTAPPLVVWGAILLAAVAFGAGHLPATASRTSLTATVVVRALVLNGLAAVVFGWLFWQVGLVAAMIAHYVADLVLHVVPLSLADRSAQS